MVSVVCERYLIDEIIVELTINLRCEEKRYTLKVLN